MARHRFPLNFSLPLFWLLALLLAILVLLALPAGVQAAPADAPAQAVMSDGGTWYVVRPGDTLYRIARRFGTSVNAIARANHLADPSRIKAGQRLWIPRDYGPSPPPGGGTWYIVRKGDNLFRIALHHGLTVQALARANHIPDPNRIKAGQRLWIPRDHKPYHPPGPHPYPPHGGVLPPVKGEWTGNYYDNKELNGGPARTETTDKIDYNWGAGSPDGLSADNFSAMWTGTFDFSPGTYRFLVTADDGVRLYLDETPIIEAWRDQSATGLFKDVNIEGGKHIVRVEYYESTQDASISVSWQRLY